MVETFDKPEGKLLGYEDFTTLMKRPNSPDSIHARFQDIFVSPPFDITHTLIYDAIDNKMALKRKGSKEFSNKKAIN